MRVLTLPEKVMKLWGWDRAASVADEYKLAFANRPLVMRDLAMMCNAAAPIEGVNEFDRGVEEGKRRVWLHVARMCGLQHADFVPIADGTNDVR
jgi:hypothetical protein